MADPGLSEIVTTTLRNRGTQLADNMSRNNALWLRLRRRGYAKTFSGGRTIVRPLNYANNQTFQWYSGYQVLNIAPSTVITAAEYPIRQSAIAVSISGLEELQNSGPEAIIDLLESRIENAEDTFANGMALALYGDGSVTGTINGLGNIISTSPSSGTVGGISRATWAFWQNQAYGAVTNGGAVASAANIYSYMMALWMQLVRGNDMPDLIVADNNYYNLYDQSLTAIQRITKDTSDVAQEGFMSLKFKNADVVLDGGYQGASTDPLPIGTGGQGASSALGGEPASSMRFINTKYLRLMSHANRNIVPLDPDRFSVNQDAMVRLIAWAGNLVADNCFLQGVLYNS